MNLYNVIMKAADHIEGHPEQFDFHECSIPSGRVGNCGSPGCALGWIGFFAGIRATEDVSAVAGHKKDGGDSLLKVNQGDFYKRMDEFCALWIFSAEGCARALRGYAAKYHAPATPDWNALASAPMQEPVNV